MYLVDLENQLAKVWERLTSIRLPNRLDAARVARERFSDPELGIDLCICVAESGNLYIYWYMGLTFSWLFLPVESVEKDIVLIGLFSLESVFVHKLNNLRLSLRYLL